MYRCCLCNIGHTLNIGVISWYRFSLQVWTVKWTPSEVHYTVTEIIKSDNPIAYCKCPLLPESNPIPRGNQKLEKVTNTLTVSPLFNITTCFKKLKCALQLWRRRNPNEMQEKTWLRTEKTKIPKNTYLDNRLFINTISVYKRLQSFTPDYKCLKVE